MKMIIDVIDYSMEKMKAEMYSLDLRGKAVLIRNDGCIINESYIYPSDTDNHFKGQPVYTMVTWILDADDDSIKSSIGTAGV